MPSSSPSPRAEHGLDRDLGRDVAQARRHRDRAALWQIVVWSGWKEEYVLPGPVDVFRSLFENFGDYVDAAAITLQRAVVGFAIAVVIGTAIGALVARSRILRSAVGSMVTGLMTMPSIAWFPRRDRALRAQRERDPLRDRHRRRTVDRQRLHRRRRQHPADPAPRRAACSAPRAGSRSGTSCCPAALPTYVAGLKQGWAFAWRSLLAGELLVQIAGKTSLGRELDTRPPVRRLPRRVRHDDRDPRDRDRRRLAVFGIAERRIRNRYGLIDAADA